MARRRRNKQSLRRGNASSGSSTDASCNQLSSGDEVSESDDASLLEVEGPIFISSDDDKGEKEKTTESSDSSYGKQNSGSSLGSVDRTSDQFTGKVNSDSERESVHEVTSGDVDHINSGENEISDSVEDSGEETIRETPKGKEIAEEEEDGDCIVQEVHVVKGDTSKKKNKKRRSYNFSPPDTIPVGWRTRSFTKNGKRVDYTPYYNYKNAAPVTVSDSEESSEFEKSDSESDSESCTDSDSGSDKQGCQPEERMKSGKHSARKAVVRSSGTGTRGTLQRKRARTHKDAGARMSSSGSSDLDNVPILERLNKKRKQNSNEEGCSRAPFEEFDAFSVSSSDDANGTVGNVRKSNSFAKEKRFGKSKYKKRRRHECIPDKKLFDFLMRSLDADGGDALESSHFNLPKELPMVFNFESNAEPLIEKSEFEELVDEAWADFEFALGVENLGSYKPDEATTREDAVYIAAGNYCANGEHEMHLDEQIGYKCQHCSYIETEIRDIFPDFATLVRNAPAGRNQMDDSGSLRLCDLHRKPDIQEMPESPFPKIGTVWDLFPGSIDTMYPHQKEAFEFMWHSLAGGIQLDALHIVAFQSDKLGCFISHAPGTGKTRLAIVFIQTYMKAFPNCHPVVIAPSNLLKTWETEFKKWSVSLPFHDMNSEEFTGKEDKELLDIANGRPHTINTRMIKLSSWLKGNGVLGISYSLFSKYISKRLNACLEVGPIIGNALLEKPGILILDEAHIPRNENSQSWNALSVVKTKKRILLSGTPFQNNFSELYNTLCLVRPDFMKNSCVQTENPNKIESLLHKKRNKSTKDIWTTPTRNVTAANAEEIRAILKPIVHVYNGEILKYLPGKRECVIILNPEETQCGVIQKLGQANNSNTFDRECKISLASIHPCLLASTNLTESEASLLDNELKNLGDDPYAGVKTKFVVEFIRLLNSNPLPERVLIFSQYIEPLKLIKKQLTKMLPWTEGSEVLEIHGKIPLKERERSITSFNDMNSKARVLLASTKACSEGISLIGASRVVLLDVVWNPSVGKQAISRAWRIGQQRVVYTYNLITAGTDEMEKYGVQMQKEKLSELVFAPKDFVPNPRKGTICGEVDECDLVLEDRVLAAITSSEALKGMFSNIYYSKSSNWIFSSGLEDLSRSTTKG